MAEVKFLQLSPGWQKKNLKMHQIDALKYGIFKCFLFSLPPRGVISISPFSPSTHFHAWYIYIYIYISHFRLHLHGQHVLTLSRLSPGEPEGGQHVSGGAGRPGQRSSEGETWRMSPAGQSVKGCCDDVSVLRWAPRWRWRPTRACPARPSSASWRTPASTLWVSLWLVGLGTFRWRTWVTWHPFPQVRGVMMLRFLNKLKSCDVTTSLGCLTNPRAARANEAKHANRAVHVTLIVHQYNATNTSSAARKPDSGLSSFEDRQEWHFHQQQHPPPPQNENFGYQSVARNSRMLYFHWLLD